MAVPAPVPPVQDEDQDEDEDDSESEGAEWGGFESGNADEVEEPPASEVELVDFGVEDEQLEVVSEAEALRRAREASLVTAEEESRRTRSSTGAGPSRVSGSSIRGGSPSVASMSGWTPQDDEYQPGDVVCRQCQDHGTECRWPPVENRRRRSCQACSIRRGRCEGRGEAFPAPRSAGRSKTAEEGK